MNGRRLPLLLPLLCLGLLLASPARAHVGSPDVFFDGNIGPYPAKIAIRMPPVIPGRAEIEVRPVSDRPLQVSVLPLYSKIPVKNSPPPEPALPAVEEPGLYRGELWLMRPGGYSVEVKVRGDAGEGAVQIPVNSVATYQMPLPPFLAAVLAGLGILLLVGGLAIVRAAAGESTLPPGAALDRPHHRRGMVATSIAAVICVGSLVGGRAWWNAEEAHFRRDLREGVWPDLGVEVRTEGSQRILRLTLGEKAFANHAVIPLLPDHGKLLHIFLIGEGGNGSFAHAHPVRKDGKTFELTLPPLREGDYKIFVDLTLSGSGLSSTASSPVHLPPPPAPATSSTPGSLSPDPDDSWAVCPAASVPAATDPAPIYRFDDGLQLVWKPHPPLRVRRDAAFQFEVRDATGNSVPLEPYMGMISHAAVMRADSGVFAHLHPAGNFSMAAQSFFESKVAGEAAAAAATPAPAPEMDHSKMHHGTAPTAGASTFYLPYEFPSAGDYHLWVQFKTAGQVRTARFEVRAEP